MTMHGTLPPEPAAAPLSLREQELAAIVGAYNDVTERLKSAHERLCGEVARLREEVRRKNAELRRRERLAAIGEMAAALAHEIRNPLGGISLYASLLERTTEPDSAARKSAGKITEGVRLLERLVSEILDFAQERPLERRRHDWAAVAETLRDAVRPWESQSGAALHIEGDLLEGGVVYCDRDRLQQVLVNLVINGLQAAGRDGQVRVHAGERNRGVEISVTDTGPGIDESQRDRIFNPFFTTKASGTGLGLAIVHRIVEAHGGSIRASNLPSGGAKFVVWLPDESAAEEIGNGSWSRSGRPGP